MGRYPRVQQKGETVPGRRPEIHAMRSRLGPSSRKNGEGACILDGLGAATCVGAEEGAHLEDCDMDILVDRSNPSWLTIG